MTIKELETRCGLDRATIRYYEKEGLIAPARQANGYRDYSEADALALEKIALLRRLELSLEDIRAVQSGEVPLALALQRQDENLRSRLQGAARALEISRAIQNEGASYTTLQPAKYQAQLPPPTPEYRIPAPKAQPAEPAAGHPWRRYLARSLDLSLWGLPAAVILLFVLGISWRSDVFTLLHTALTLILAAVLEPLLLSRWGYTPGKWLLGLRLRDARGRLLDYGEASVRTWMVLAQGMGLQIPIVSLVCCWLAYRRSQPDNETLPPVPPRDQPWDEVNDYTVEPRSWRPKALWAVAYVAVLALTVAVMLLSARPNLLARPMDTARYVKSVNHVLDYSVAGNPFLLREDGSWSKTRTNHYAAIMAGSVDQFHQTITETDGLVTTVSMTYPIHENDKFWSRGDGQVFKQATIAALLGRDLTQQETERLNDLYRAAEGVLTLEGWTVKQVLYNRTADFTENFVLRSNNWEYIGEGEAPVLNPPPTIWFSVQKTE